MIKLCRSVGWITSGSSLSTSSGRVEVYVAGGASLLAFCAALAVFGAWRSSPNAHITDFGDATG